MPSFQIDFEVYCETCGEGLCHQSEGVNTHNRKMPAVRVSVCQHCIKNAKAEAEDEATTYCEKYYADERAELEEQIEQLRSEIKRLESERGVSSGSENEKE